MATLTRRSTRFQKTTTINNEHIDDEVVVAKVVKEEDTDDSDSEDEHRFEFEGTFFKTYQEMVNAKRKRNEEYLKQNGLWKPMARIQQTSAARKEGNGLKKRKVSKAVPSAPRRKSSRLQGTPADGRFVEHEGGGSFVIAGESSKGATTTPSSSNIQSTPASRGRVNDGGPLSLEESINLCDFKWIQETTVEAARKFTKETLLPLNIEKTTESAASKSPTSVARMGGSTVDSIREQIEGLSVDDGNLVAKVTPERIYSVATHPSKSNLIVGAGDKNGYVGLWNVDDNSTGRDGVHLFRFHTRPVNTMEWTSQGLLSSSYDGTVRYFDVAKESVEEVVSTNEEDNHFYTQYLSLDPRANKNDQSFFLSTSMGSVMHVDRRMGGSRSQKSSVTFHALCSNEGKKINSVSLHRDGYCLATGGLDRTVKFWDLRKFNSNNSMSSAKEAKGALLGEHFNRLSVNSAFFSPSGEYLVTTNMANSLNIYHNPHLQGSGKTGKKSAIVQPEHVIRHNNNTGRWLTTFMAQWHPELDIFCVGSMEKPRAIDVFNGATGDHLRAIQGEALTAVASRCCFHRSSDQLTLVGGNSSGRVTVVR